LTLVGENAAQFSDVVDPGNANAAAMRFIDDVARNSGAVFPGAEAMRKLQMLTDHRRRERRLRNRMRTEITVR